MRAITKLYMLGLILILALVACGEAADNMTSATTTPVPGAIKVAMIIPGEIDDGSWGQIGYEGLKLIEKEVGAQVAYTTHVPFGSPVEPVEFFRQYAEEGFDLIIGHGGGYVDEAETVAEEFPNSTFAVVGRHEGNNKNYGSFSYRAEETGYLSGVVAALKTKSNKIAFIGAMEDPLLNALATAYELGAKSINPGVQVNIEWLGSWTDQDKARQIADAAIESGADVLMVNADAAALGVYDAAARAGVYAIGGPRDDHELAPDAILTSIVVRIPKLLLQGAELVQRGRFEGKQYTFGLSDGVQDIAPFYGMLSPEEEETVSLIRSKIISGETRVVR